jgi:hypothetical protein
MWCYCVRSSSWVKMEKVLQWWKGREMLILVRGREWEHDDLCECRFHDVRTSTALLRNIGDVEFEVEFADDWKGAECPSESIA